MSDKRPRFEVVLRQLGSRVEMYCVFDNETGKDINRLGTTYHEDLDEIVALMNDMQDTIDTYHDISMDRD